MVWVGQCEVLAKVAPLALCTALNGLLSDCSVFRKPWTATGIRGAALRSVLLRVFQSEPPVPTIFLLVPSQAFLYFNSVSSPFPVRLKTRVCAIGNHCELWIILRYAENNLCPKRFLRKVPIVFVRWLEFSVGVVVLAHPCKIKIAYICVYCAENYYFVMAVRQLTFIIKWFEYSEPCHEIVGE